jgi:hypothetical protein
VTGGKGAQRSDLVLNLVQTLSGYSGSSQKSLSRRCDRVAVGGHDALVDGPGDLHCKVPLVGEHCVEAGTLPAGEQLVPVRSARRMP